jgi:hypothetical protein
MRDLLMPPGYVGLDGANDETNRFYAGRLPPGKLGDVEGADHGTPFLFTLGDPKVLH